MNVSQELSMMTKVLALNLLCQVRLWVTESMRRRLLPEEVKELADTVAELTQCVGDEDPFTVRQVKVIKATLQRAFDHQGTGSHDLRKDAILHAHALSGHLVWE